MGEGIRGGKWLKWRREKMRPQERRGWQKIEPSKSAKTISLTCVAIYIHTYTQIFCEGTRLKTNFNFFCFSVKVEL